MQNKVGLRATVRIVPEQRDMTDGIVLPARCLAQLKHEPWQIS